MADTFDQRPSTQPLTVSVSANHAKIDHHSLNMLHMPQDRSLLIIPHKLSSSLYTLMPSGFVLDDPGSWLIGLHSTSTYAVIKHTCRFFDWISQNRNEQSGATGRSRTCPRVLNTSADSLSIDQVCTCMCKLRCSAVVCCVIITCT